MRIDSIDIRSSFTKYNDNQRIDLSKKINNCIFFYGSNGTGKSSLSKLFSISNMAIDGNNNYKERLSLLKTIDSSKDLDVSICYNDENFTIFTNDVVNPIKVPVFNKDYIDSKITYQSDFKNNLFQEQASSYGIELESKTNYNNNLAKIEENNTNKNMLLEKINQKIEIGISQTLKDTKTTKANQKYNDYCLESFLNLDPKKIPINNLEKLRDSHRKYISNLKDFNDNDIIEFSLEEFINEQDLKENIKEINNVIKFSADKTKLNFVKQYLDNFSEEEKDWKIKGANLLKSNKCPFCEQDVSDVDIVQMYKIYVNSNLRKTENFINEQIKYFADIGNNIDLQYKINESKAKNIDRIFNSNITFQIEEYINELREFNEKIIELLKNKLKEDYIYNDCSNILSEIDLNIVDDIIQKYNQLLKNIEDTNTKILKSSSERKKANEEYLDNTGKFLVYNSVRNELNEFKLLTEKSIELEIETKKLKKIYQDEIKEKNELVKTINNILDDFTITNYRVDEKFDLFLNDCEVSTNAEKLLSDGEKNIIAFALFISELRLMYMENEKDIIFIDDPITSVDYPNLYSIYNYLIDIISENSNSQIIITSHNILFLNLFKFRYNGNATYFKLKEESNGKTNCCLDTDTSDSIYLEKLKEIYNIAITNTIDSKQKLYIHNYCRYVVETLSRFEFPNYKKESSSSDFYIRKLKEQIKENPDNLNVTNNNLDILNNIINKGSHATIEIVHDNEYFDDEHYVKCCKTIIEIIKTKYRGQFELLSFDKTKEISVDRLNSEVALSEEKVNNS